jgi:hypothetical protein
MNAVNCIQQLETPSDDIQEMHTERLEQMKGAISDDDEDDDERQHEPVSSEEQAARLAALDNEWALLRESAVELVSNNDGRFNAIVSDLQKIRLRSKTISSLSQAQLPSKRKKRGKGSRKAPYKLFNNGFH